MSTSYSNRVERYTAAQRRHRSIFACVAAAGSAGLIIMMTRGAATWLVAAWTSLFVIGYALVLSLSPLHHVSDRQKGDACNHLGFIFGLVVLTACLWLYDPRWGDVRPVLRAFAAALAGVVCGFTLKVLFQQFREDSEEIDAQVRGALGDAARDVHVQVLGIIQDLSTLRATLWSEISRHVPTDVAPPTGRTNALTQEPRMTKLRTTLAMTGFAFVLGIVFAHGGGAGRSQRIEGLTGTSRPYFSGWLDFKARDFQNGDRIVVTVGGTATSVLLRLKEENGDANQPDIVVAEKLVVGKDRTVEVTLTSDYKKITQVSAHGGPRPFGIYDLTPSNGYATVTRVDLVRP
jgi:hypothetical protein